MNAPIRSHRAVIREYRRVVRAMNSGKHKDNLYAVTLLMGMQQALAWFVYDNAASPTKCIPPPPKKRSTR